MYTHADNISFVEQDSIDQARKLMALGSALMTFLMYRCDFIFTRETVKPFNTAVAYFNKGKPTVATNLDFWMNELKTPEQRAFVIFHEVSHIFLLHGKRGVEMGYDKDVWGSATDYHINLVAAGLGRDPRTKAKTNCVKMQKYFSLPDFVLYDEAFIGMSADEIYHILIEKQKSGEPIDMPFDTIVPSSGDNDGNGDGNGDNDVTVIPDAVTEANLRNILQSAVVFCEMSNSIGSAEGAYARHIKEFIKPHIPWKDLINMSIQRNYSDTITYNKISVLSQDDIIFPSKRGDHLKIVFGVDTSGSMTHNDYMDAIGGVVEIAETFDNWEITIMSCDVVATIAGVYNSDDHTVEDLFEAEYRGGGGTDMTPILKAFNKMQEESDDYTSVIIATDGHIPVHEELINAVPRVANAIFLVTRSGNNKLVVDGAEVIKVN